MRKPEGIHAVNQDIPNVPSGFRLVKALKKSELDGRAEEALDTVNPG